MRSILLKIDALLDKIPKHIQDLIKKGSLALFALVALIAVIIGIQSGFDSATPGGFKLVENNKDLFYLQQLRAENEKKRVLIEDVEIDTMRFSSNMQESIDKFHRLGKKTQDSFLNSNERLDELEEDIDLRKKDPGFLSEEAPFSRTNRHVDTSLKEQDLLELKKDDASKKVEDTSTSNTPIIKQSDSAKTAEKTKEAGKRKLEFLGDE